MLSEKQLEAFRLAEPFTDLLQMVIDAFPDNREDFYPEVIKKFDEFINFSFIRNHHSSPNLDILTKLFPNHREELLEQHEALKLRISKMMSDKPSRYAPSFDPPCGTQLRSIFLGGGVGPIRGLLFDGPRRAAAHERLTHLLASNEALRPVT